MSKKPLDVEKWARRGNAVWLEEGVMILLDAEPFDVKSHIWSKAEGFDDIYDTAIRDIRADKLHATPVRGQYLGRGQYRWWLSLSLPNLLEWARGKEYRVSNKVQKAVNRFHPEAKDRPQVTAENSDLTPPKPQKETPVQRSVRLRERHKKLIAGGSRHPTKTIAEEEKLSTARVRVVMNLTRPQG